MTRRAGQVITLHRLEGPLVDLTIGVVDGRNGIPLSPTEVELQRLHGNSPDYRAPSVPTELALGKATTAPLPAWPLPQPQRLSTGW